MKDLDIQIVAGMNYMIAKYFADDSARTYVEKLNSAVMKMTGPIANNLQSGVSNGMVDFEAFDKHKAFVASWFGAYGMKLG